MFYVFCKSRYKISECSNSGKPHLPHNTSQYKLRKAKSDEMSYRDTARAEKIYKSWGYRQVSLKMYKLRL